MIVKSLSNSKNYQKTKVFAVQSIGMQIKNTNMEVVIIAVEVIM